MTVSIADLLEVVPVSSGVVGAPGPEVPQATPSLNLPTASPLRMSVAWGNLVRVDADIHMTGHYEGVAPSSAEGALDAAISAGRRGVIAEHTRRGWLTGSLGEITYFPVRECAGPAIRRAAVAGMGRPGTLSEARAGELYLSLLAELLDLGVRTVALVLIGSGAGNLSVTQASRAMVRGFSTVLGVMPASRRDRDLPEVDVEELDRVRADQIRRALHNEAAHRATLVSVAAGVAENEELGGDVTTESAAVLAISALGRLARARPGEHESEDEEAMSAAGGTLLTGLLDHLPASVRAKVGSRLAEIQDDPGALSVGLYGPTDGSSSTAPTRIFVSSGDGHLRWSALTARATIPERQVALNIVLVDQLVNRLTRPSKGDAAELPRLLTRFVVLVDFQRLVSGDNPLVLEVDADSARVPWEFLTDRAGEQGDDPLPLAVRQPLARQMRTAYSRAEPDETRSGGLRALVIGDPGDPSRHGLPRARQEAVAIVGQLKARGVHVDAFIGAPGTETPEAGPATQLDVLNRLPVYDYDFVHYAGHATFDSSDPRASGWLFADGVLSARELAQLTRAPRLVVANACWSAARAAAVPTAPTRDRDEMARLTPVLADEFLRVGVMHYIGTSWPIPDGYGEQFAISLYQSILGEAPRPPAPLGEAVCSGRRALFVARGEQLTDRTTDEQWSAWAAYQHYGDPADVIEPRTEGQ